MGSTVILTYCYEIFLQLYKDAHSYNYKAVRRWTTTNKLGYSLLQCDKVASFTFSSNTKALILTWKQTKLNFGSFKHLEYYQMFFSQPITDFCWGTVDVFLELHFREIIVSHHNSN